MITNIIILDITSNVVLSLGMVGALSIVRFRTAIKEPSDIAFLFWSISIGIVTAAGLIPLAVFGSILIGLILILYSKYSDNNQAYILFVHYINEEAELKAKSFIASNVNKYNVKSKSVSKYLIEVNYEVRLNNEDHSFINTLSEFSGVEYTIMVSYNGEYLS